MANYPNAVEMMFGRIDRNNDTGYRDRSLQQNQNQFNTQIDLDKAKLEEARKQFLENLNLQRDQFNNTKQAQQFNQNTMTGEAIAKGLFKPMTTGNPNNGIKPDNMFMQQALPDTSNNPADPNMPTLNLNGVAVQPINQFTQGLQQNAASYKQKLQFENQAKADRINTLTQLGVHPALAFIQAEDPQLAAHIMGSPQNMMAYLTMVGKGDPGAMNVAKHVMEYMSGYQGAIAQASETEADKAYRLAMGNQANAHASLFRSQQANQDDMNAGLIAMNKYAGEVSKLMPTTDGRYVGLIRQKIDADPNLTPGQRSAAIRQLNNESTIRTGLPSIFDQFNLNRNPAVTPPGSNQLTPTVQITPNDTSRSNNWTNRAVVPGAPTPSTDGGTSRQSGSGPTVVNTKPPTVTGPVGSNASSALQYTQRPQMPQPNAQGLVPIMRSDGSVDGYVSPEQWQELNQPATGFGGMGLSNPLSGFSQMMLDYQRKSAAQRQQQFNPNSQGFGYRPPNY